MTLKLWTSQKPCNVKDSVRNVKDSYFSNFLSTNCSRFLCRMGKIPKRFSIVTYIYRRTVEDSFVEWARFPNVFTCDLFYRRTVEDSFVEWARFPNVFTCDLFYRQTVEDSFVEWARFPNVFQL